MSLIGWADRKFYPQHARNWDDAMFRERILAKLTPDAVVLDLGAGAGIVPQMNFRGRAAKICGADLDPRVLDNPFLDDARVADAGSVPYEDGSFDLVFSDNVLEHLAEPLGVFREVARVLKPGGVFLFKTPNKHHYMPLVARATPHWFHRFVNKRRGRASEDTFPTLYRANCRSDVARLASQSGLTVRSLEFVEGRPEYLRMTFPTYLVGTLYERAVNRFDHLERFRIVLIGTLQKS